MSDISVSTPMKMLETMSRGGYMPRTHLLWRTWQIHI